MKVPSEDIDRIMSVMSAAFDPAFGEAWNRRQVEDAMLVGNCHYFLANERGEPAQRGEKAVGFSLSRTGVDEEELLLFAVTPQYRRRGIGQCIMKNLTEAAKFRGVRKLFLEMRRGNPAETLYRINGFYPIGIRPNYYQHSDGQRMDAITFERDV